MGGSAPGSEGAGGVVETMGTFVTLVLIPLLVLALVLNEPELPEIKRLEADQTIVQPL
jgi:hypothetical protein